MLYFQVVYSISGSRSWETPSAHQYHIQTDEGPERYFRYQTDSTYAWIDDDGMLRQRDYIADNAGYRILKSKNVYVGRNINVGDAVKAAKKLPSAGSSLAKNYHQRRPVIYSSTHGVTSSTYDPILSSTPRTYVDITSNSISSGPFVTSTEAPVVEITPHSYLTPTSTYLPPTNTYSSPSSSYLPPVNFTREYLPPAEPPRVYLPSTTEAPTVYLPPVTEPPRVYLPSTTETPKVYLPPVTEGPRVRYTSTPTSTELYLPPVTEPPRIYLPSTTEAPKVYLPPVTEPPRIYLPSTTETPKVYLPPVTEPPKIYLPSTTESPRIYLPPRTETPTYLPPAKTYLPSSTESPSYLSPDQYAVQPIYAEELDQNSVEYNPYVRQVANSYSQLSAMANDIKDIKSSQAQLSTDVAYCRTLLQQHSDSISRHDDKIATCEADIQSLQNAQTELSSNIAVIESKLTTAMNSNAPNRCTSTNDPANQAETLEILRRSHNVLLRGVPEGDNDPNLNGPTYPIDRNGRPYDGQAQDSRNHPQYTKYDGVSVTNDGFRYYIPRAYHEEETLPDDKRSGSFGYIDPFGIRRVIYYNTGPGEGFKHRKNNRYVGFDATPYDPRLV
nr:unnamed protein product [Callosobruchus analis]